jgi:hypothetical protein
LSKRSRTIEAVSASVDTLGFPGIKVKVIVFRAVAAPSFCHNKAKILLKKEGVAAEMWRKRGIDPTPATIRGGRKRLALKRGVIYLNLVRNVARSGPNLPDFDKGDSLAPAGLNIAFPRRPLC